MKVAKKKGISVLLVRAETLDSGKIRLIFEDGVDASDRLVRRGLYTSRDFDESEFLALPSSDDALADIGMAVIARLLAYRSPASG